LFFFGNFFIVVVCSIVANMRPHVLNQISLELVMNSLIPNFVVHMEDILE
jgi:hypothetical protein